MADIDEEKLKQLFKEVTAVLEQQKEQKARGLNDYNLLTSVLSAGDEVRLHSRFIYSMINKEGVHYQSTLFLKLFIQDVLSHKNLPKIECDTLKVYKEWQGGEENGGIDLFLTDGEYYFIIENKLYASDQPRQIARYIKAVKKEYNLTKQQVKEKVFVYYLSPQGKEPSELSLGAFQVKQEKILLAYIKEDEPAEDKPKKEIDRDLDAQLSESVVNFKLISYKKEITQWLDSCLKESENLTNLNQAFLTYKDVVERVTRMRKSKVSTITEYLITKDKELDSTAISNLKLASQIERSMGEVKGIVLHNMFKNIEARHKLSEVEDEHYKIIGELIKNRNFKGNCQNWFVKNKSATRNVGVLFNIEGSEFFLCIVAAARSVYVGVVSKVGESAKSVYDEKLKKLKLLARVNDGGYWNKVPVTWYAKNAGDNIFEFDEKSIDFLTKRDGELDTVIGDILNEFNTHSMR